MKRKKRRNKQLKEAGLDFMNKPDSMVSRISANKKAGPSKQLSGKDYLDAMPDPDERPPRLMDLCKNLYPEDFYDSDEEVEVEKPQDLDRSNKDKENDDEEDADNEKR